MIFPYPALRKGVTVYKCRRGARHWFEAETREGERISISPQIAGLLVRMEGGHFNPYSLPEFADHTEPEMDRLLLRLVRCGLLNKHSRVDRHEGLFFLVSLLPVRLRRTRAVCWTTLCLLLSAPLALAASLLLLPSRFMSFGSGSLSESAALALGTLFLLIGCLLHELGHGLCAAAMGGTTGEMGVFTLLCVPVGFYLTYQEAPNSSRFARFAVAVSGVCMNVLTALLCFLLCGHAGALDDALLLGGINNLILVIFNLLPCRTLDGTAALEAITGIPDIHRRALAFLLSAKERRNLLRRRPGQAAPILGAYLIAGLGQTAAILWSAASILCLFLKGGIV